MYLWRSSFFLQRSCCWLRRLEPHTNAHTFSNHTHTNKCALGVQVRHLPGTRRTPLEPANHTHSPPTPSLTRAVCHASATLSVRRKSRWARHPPLECHMHAASARTPVLTVPRLLCRLRQVNHHASNQIRDSNHPAPSPQPLLSPPPVHVRRAVEECKYRAVCASPTDAGACACPHARGALTPPG